MVIPVEYTNPTPQPPHTANPRKATIRLLLWATATKPNADNTAAANIVDLAEVIPFSLRRPAG
ncbi:hypothetical protein ATCCBAA256_04320 [Mycobacterium montefiorense]|nr:hypothetical protein ATCCBAA256_04320 [Mycobacterium montefiorense]